MAAVSKVSTANSGAAYVDECVDRGVPVPSTVIDVDNHWTLINTPIADPFMAPELDDARLWTFENTPAMLGPDGICMALPRGHLAQNATVVGMICMGWNGNTCYFTNPANTSFSPIEAIAIDELIGGTDLVGAPEGVCSDCHAGENPFVIHPEDPAFIAAIAAVSRHFPDAWPTPIVPDAFPGNPEPLEQLGPVSDGQLECDYCHQAGGVGGRLPLLSTNYPEYCQNILDLSLGGDPSIPRTMPLSNYDSGQFSEHAAWLTASCETNPNSGVVVPFTPPQAVVLPPDLEAPYACSKHVRVTNAIFGATLKLSINGTQVATGVFRDPYTGFVFNLGATLTEGQLISVSQTVAGTQSTAAVVFVRDHTEDYPNGLPAPSVSPTPIYACASAIAVQNVKGVELTIAKTRPNNTARSYTFNTGVSHTWKSGLGNPAFEVGTTFKVRQKLCTDTSPYSAAVSVEAAPAALPEIVFDPPLVVGQPVIAFESITQGARVTLTELNSATVVYDNSSVPYTDWHVDVTSSLGGPIQATHDIEAVQKLCAAQSGSPDIPPPAACTEQTLVPEIAPPHAGDDFVLVTYAIPGSNLRVFDGTPAELGNGSSQVIGLTRDLVLGEVITVTATLGGCSVNRAFSIVVSE